MPIKIPENAGKPYQPSNGSEGDRFMAEFCEQCTQNKFDYETGKGETCNILMLTMIRDFSDEDYPTEWVFDSEGCPTCTAFERAMEE